MALFIWPLTPVSVVGGATEATALQIEQNTSDTVTELQTLNASDLATETTLASRASEATLASLEAKDFATETTLGTLATETTLASLEAKNFATEATLLNIEAFIDILTDKSPAGFFSGKFDTLQVTATSANGPTQIVSKVGGLAGSTVQTLNIVYDINGDFESAVVS